jgi:hypothetical protein
VGDGGGLKAVEFVEGVVYRRVPVILSVSFVLLRVMVRLRNEVVHIVIFGSSSLCLVDKGR